MAASTGMRARIQRHNRRSSPWVRNQCAGNSRCRNGIIDQSNQINPRFSAPTHPIPPQRDSTAQHSAKTKPTDCLVSVYASKFAIPSPSATASSNHPRAKQQNPNQTQASTKQFAAPRANCRVTVKRRKEGSEQIRRMHYRRRRQWPRSPAAAMRQRRPAAGRGPAPPPSFGRGGGLSRTTS